MPRIRSLNGLPNELTQKYISTLMYYDKGYMLDWIWKRFKVLQLNSAEIDFFQETSIPSGIMNKPIKVYSPDLRRHIEARLEQNGFESDYIYQGYFKVHSTDVDKAFGRVAIQCVLVSKENRVFTGKTYHEPTYPIAESFFERIFRK